MDDTDGPMLHGRGKASEKESHLEKKVARALSPEMTNILWRKSTPRARLATVWLTAIRMLRAKAICVWHDRLV